MYTRESFVEVACVCDVSFLSLRRIKVVILSFPKIAQVDKLKRLVSALLRMADVVATTTSQHADRLARIRLEVRSVAAVPSLAEPSARTVPLRLRLERMRPVRVPPHCRCHSAAVPWGHSSPRLDRGLGWRTVDVAVG